MPENIIIAIDGFTACGKSTLARELANKLNYIHIDTGAMYRAVTLFLLDHQVDWNKEGELQKALSAIRITFKPVGKDADIQTFLNGMNVGQQIRSQKVARYVSEVSAIKAVRTTLVEQQRKMAKGGGVILDGRDIGTIVFPHAELKLFMTADFDVRLERRYQEMKQKGLNATKEAVRKNLKDRDYQDTHRKESPLKKADDAILLDNTNMTRAEQLNFAYRLAKKKINV